MSVHSALSQPHITIIFPIEAELHAYVSCLDAWQQLVLVIPGAQHESIEPIMLTLYDELGKDNGIVAIHPHVSWPELDAGDGRGVEYELLGGVVVGGGGL